MIKHKTDYEKVCNIVLITSSIIVFAYILILVCIKDKSILIIDKTITTFVTGNRSRFFDYLFVLLSYLGETITISIFCFILLLLPNRNKLGVPITIITALSAIINFVIKILVMRARPQGYFLPDSTLFYTMPAGYSFPSGHAQTANVFYLSLTILLLKYFKTNLANILFITFALLFCILICFARVYLGVHYFSDIMAGLSIMIFVLSLGLYLIKNTKLNNLNIYE